MFAGQHLFDAEHSARGDAQRVQLTLPICRRFGREAVFERRAQLVAVALALLAAGIIRVFEQIQTPEMLAQRLPLLVLVGGDVEQAFAGPEGTRRRGGRVFIAVGAGGLPADEEIRQHPAHGAEQAFEHGYVDQAPARAGVERGVDGHSSGQPADGVGDGGTHAQRRAVCVAGHRHQA